MNLDIGDATFCKSFTKVGFSEDGSIKAATNFRPPKGQQFVTLLIGTISAKATDCDIESMLNSLGFYRRDEPK